MAPVTATQTRAPTWQSVQLLQAIDALEAYLPEARQLYQEMALTIAGTPPPNRTPKQILATWSRLNGLLAKEKGNPFVAFHRAMQDCVVAFQNHQAQQQQGKGSGTSRRRAKNNGPDE